MPGMRKRESRVGCHSVQTTLPKFEGVSAFKSIFSISSFEVVADEELGTITSDGAEFETARLFLNVVAWY